MPVSYAQTGLKLQIRRKKIKLDNKTRFGYSDGYCLRYWAVPKVNLGTRHGLTLLKKKLRVVTESGGSVLGAVLLAGVGTCSFGDIKDAAGRLKQKGKTYQLSIELAQPYRELYRIYRSLYENTKAEASASQKVLAGFGERLSTGKKLGSELVILRRCQFPG